MQTSALDVLGPALQQASVAPWHLAGQHCCTGTAWHGPDPWGWHREQGKGAGEGGSPLGTKAVGGCRGCCRKAGRTGWPLPWLCFPTHPCLWPQVPVGRGDRGSGGAEQKCWVPPCPSASAWEEGVGMLPWPRPASARCCAAGTSLPSHWTMCHIRGNHPAGAGEKSKGLGGCPPQEQGQGIPGFPEQAEG